MSTSRDNAGDSPSSLAKILAIANNSPEVYKDAGISARAQLSSPLETQGNTAQRKSTRLAPRVLSLNFSPGNQKASDKSDPLSSIPNGPSLCKSNTVRDRAASEEAYPNPLGESDSADKPGSRRNSWDVLTNASFQDLVLDSTPNPGGSYSSVRDILSNGRDIFNTAPLKSAADKMTVVENVYDNVANKEGVTRIPTVTSPDHISSSSQSAMSQSVLRTSQLNSVGDSSEQTLSSLSDFEESLKRRAQKLSTRETLLNYDFAEFEKQKSNWEKEFKLKETKVLENLEEQRQKTFSELKLMRDRLEQEKEEWHTRKKSEEGALLAMLRSRTAEIATEKEKLQAKDELLSRKLSELEKEQVALAEQWNELSSKRLEIERDFQASRLKSLEDANELTRKTAQEVDDIRKRLLQEWTEEKAKLRKLFEKEQELLFEKEKKEHAEYIERERRQWEEKEREWKRLEASWQDRKRLVEEEKEELYAEARREIEEMIAVARARSEQWEAVQNLQIDEELEERQREIVRLEEDIQEQIDEWKLKHEKLAAAEDRIMHEQKGLESFAATLQQRSIELEKALQMATLREKSVESELQSKLLSMEQLAEQELAIERNEIARMKRALKQREESLEELVEKERKSLEKERQEDEDRLERKKRQLAQNQLEMEETEARLRKKEQTLLEESKAIRSREEKLTHSAAELESLRAALEARERDIQRIHEELLQQQKDNDSQRETIAALRRHVDSSVEECERKEQELLAKEAKINSRLSDAEKAMSKRMEELRMACEAEEQRKGALLDEQRLIQDQINALQQQSKSLEAEMSAHRLKIEDIFEADKKRVADIRKIEMAKLEESLKSREAECIAKWESCEMQMEDSLKAKRDEFEQERGIALQELDALFAKKSKDFEKEWTQREEEYAERIEHLTIREKEHMEASLSLRASTENYEAALQELERERSSFATVVAEWEKEKFTDDATRKSERESLSALTKSLFDVASSLFQQQVQVRSKLHAVACSVEDLVARAKEDNTSTNFQNSILASFKDIENVLDSLPTLDSALIPTNGKGSEESKSAQHSLAMTHQATAQATVQHSTEAHVVGPLPSIPPIHNLTNLFKKPSKDSALVESEYSNKAFSDLTVPDVSVDVSFSDPISARAHIDYFINLQNAEVTFLDQMLVSCSALEKEMFVQNKYKVESNSVYVESVQLNLFRLQHKVSLTSSLCEALSAFNDKLSATSHQLSEREAELREQQVEIEASKRKYEGLVQLEKDLGEQQAALLELQAMVEKNKTSHDQLDASLRVREVEIASKEDLLEIERAAFEQQLIDLRKAVEEECEKRRNEFEKELEARDTEQETVLQQRAKDFEAEMQERLRETTKWCEDTKLATEKDTQEIRRIAAQECDKVVSRTQETCDEMHNDAERKVELATEHSQMLLEDAKSRASKIIEEASEKAAKIEADMRGTMDELLEAQHAQLKQAQDAVAEAKRSEEVIQAKVHEVDESLARAKTLEDENLKVKAQLEEKFASLGERESKLADRSRELEVLQSTLEAERTNLANDRQELRKKEQQLMEMSSDVESVRQRIDQEMEALKVEKDLFQASIEAHDAQRDSWFAEKTKEEVRMKKLVDAITESEKAIQVKTEEIESLMSEYNVKNTALKEREDALDLKLESLEQSQRALEKERRKLGYDREAYNDQMAELEEREKALARRESVLQQATEVLDKRIAVFEEQTRQTDKETTEKVDEMMKMLLAREAECQKRLDSVTEAERRVSETRDTIEEQSKELQKVQAEIEQKRRELESLAMELRADEGALEAANQDLERRLETLENSEKSLQQEKESLTKMLKTQSEMHDRLLAEHENLELRNQEFEEKLADYEERRAQLETEQSRFNEMQLQFAEERKKFTEEIQSQSANMLEREEALLKKDEELTARTKEIELLQEKVHSENERVLRLEQEVGDRRKTLEAFITEIEAQDKKAHKELQLREERISTREGEINVLQKVIIDKERELSVSMAQLEAERKAIKDVEKRLQEETSAFEQEMKLFATKEKEIKMKEQDVMKMLQEYMDKKALDEIEAGRIKDLFEWEKSLAEREKDFVANAQNLEDQLNREKLSWKQDQERVLQKFAATEEELEMEQKQFQLEKADAMKEINDTKRYLELEAKRISDQEASIRARELEILGAEKELCMLTETQEEESKRLKDLEHFLESEKERFAKEVQAYQELREALQHEEDKLSSHENIFEEKRIALEALQEKFEEEKADLYKEIEDRERVSADREAQLKELQLKLEKKQRDIESEQLILDQRVSEMELRAQELNALQERLTDIEKNLAREHDELGLNRKDLEDYRKQQEAHYQLLLESLEKEREILSNASKDIAAREKQLVELESEVMHRLKEEDTHNEELASNIHHRETVLLEKEKQLREMETHLRTRELELLAAEDEMLRRDVELKETVKHQEDEADRRICSMLQAAEATAQEIRRIAQVESTALHAKALKDAELTIQQLKEEAKGWIAKEKSIVQEEKMTLKDMEQSILERESRCIQMQEDLEKQRNEYKALIQTIRDEREIVQRMKEQVREQESFTLEKEQEWEENLISREQKLKLLENELSLQKEALAKEKERQLSVDTTQAQRDQELSMLQTQLQEREERYQKTFESLGLQEKSLKEKLSDCMAVQSKLEAQRELILVQESELLKEKQKLGERLHFLEARQIESMRVQTYIEEGKRDLAKKESDFAKKVTDFQEKQYILDRKEQAFLVRERELIRLQGALEERERYLRQETESHSKLSQLHSINRTFDSSFQSNYSSQTIRNTVGASTSYDYTNAQDKDNDPSRQYTQSESDSSLTSFDVSPVPKFPGNTETQVEQNADGPQELVLSDTSKTSIVPQRTSRIGASPSLSQLSATPDQNSISNETSPINASHNTVLDSTVDTASYQVPLVSNNRNKGHDLSIRELVEQSELMDQRGSSAQTSRSNSPALDLQFVTTTLEKVRNTLSTPIRSTPLSSRIHGGVQDSPPAPKELLRDFDSQVEVHELHLSRSSSRGSIIQARSNVDILTHPSIEVAYQKLKRLNDIYTAFERNLQNVVRKSSVEIPQIPELPSLQSLQSSLDEIIYYYHTVVATPETTVPASANLDSFPPLPRELQEKLDAWMIQLQSRVNKASNVMSLLENWKQEHLSLQSTHTSTSTSSSASDILRTVTSPPLAVPPLNRVMDILTPDRASRKSSPSHIDDRKPLAESLSRSLQALDESIIEREVILKAGLLN